MVNKIEITCKNCRSVFLDKENEYINRFCSATCANEFRNKNMASLLSTKSCAVCGSEFKPRSGVHKFCSEKCKGKWKYITGIETTESQYKAISGNWKRYCERLLYCRGKKRALLTVNYLLEILERQNYKCALSGIQLTCNLEKGKKFPTNVSIDRIIPGSDGGEYNKENIQLVCVALNKWRADTKIEDFIEMCRRVTEYNEQKKTV